MSLFRFGLECEQRSANGTLGRERTYPGDSGEVEVYKHRAREIIMGVVRRGVFKTRKPEGKAGGH